ncbi:MAG: DUF4864 domain-containing protein [Pseudomonadota bacterium]
MRAFLAFLTVLILAMPLRAEEPADSIQGVIVDQIGAFQRSDLGAAFAHASPSIQRIFGNPDKFGKMVKGGYPMIWRPVRWQMLTLEGPTGAPVQTVLFEGQDGALYEADYAMIQVDGIWRINGVSLRRLPGVSS